MRAAVFHGPGDIRCEEVPDAGLVQATDALVRVTHAGICGSDLWRFRGDKPMRAGSRIGHELVGVVEEVGAEVRGLRPGDHVLAPFVWSDGTCDFCRGGLHTSCRSLDYWGGRNDGGQGEAVRCAMADGTLVPLPSGVGADDALMRRILPLTDVMATGHHAALSARVRPGVTACVVGDGAVGLCAVIAARRLGAERIIVLGHRESRLALAGRLGATDLVAERGGEAVSRVREMTGDGASCVMECVGAPESMRAALAVCRDGGDIGFVGWAHEVTIDVGADLYARNIGVRGGICPARAYIPELLADVLAERLDPSPVLDLTVPLADVGRGYAAMDGRASIKAVVVP